MSQKFKVGDKVTVDSGAVGTVSKVLHYYEVMVEKTKEDAFYPQRQLKNYNEQKNESRQEMTQVMTPFKVGGVYQNSRGDYYEVVAFIPEVMPHLPLVTYGRTERTIRLYKADGKSSYSIYEKDDLIPPKEKVTLWQDKSTGEFSFSKETPFDHPVVFVQSEEAEEDTDV